MTKLSVIIPVYNVEAYVGECLSSILQPMASTSDFELIIVNDGTKDGSMHIVRDICFGRENVRILEQENQGLSAARMKGWAEAKGEYIWFVDSDDWLEKDAISQALHAIESYRADVLATPLQWCYTDTTRNDTDIIVPGGKTLSGKEYLKAGIYRISAAPRYIFKSSVFRPEWTFFPEGLLHEDEYFGMVLLYQAVSVHILETPLYHYRQREKSIMSAGSIRSSYDIVSIHKLLMAFLDACVAPEDRLWFRQRCMEVLALSYCHSASLVGSPDFRQFQHKSGCYIFKSYLRCIKHRPAKVLLGDLIFLSAPQWYLKHKPLRYIQF